MENLRKALQFKIVVDIYLKEEYGIDLSDLFDHPNKEQTEEMVLSIIKEFTEFDYDVQNKVFTATLEDNTKFFTEVVELKNIHSLPDLYLAVGHLNEARYIRNQNIIKTIGVDLPEYLYEPVKDTLDISRDNVMSFLKQEHGIDSEKSLFEQEEDKHTEVVYDLFRNFTGCTAHPKNRGAIVYSLPQDEDLKLSYNNLPNLNHKDLLSHLRDMRYVEKTNQEIVEQTTDDRIKEIKGMMKKQEQEQEQEQEPEL